MKRKQHITAFYLETLLMIVVFISIILVLTRVFGSAHVQSSEAKSLTAAVTLAQNTAEAVSAAGSPQELQEILDEGGNTMILESDNTGGPDESTEPDSTGDSGKAGGPVDPEPDADGGEAVVMSLYDSSMQPVQITQEMKEQLKDQGVINTDSPSLIVLTSWTPDGSEGREKMIKAPITVLNGMNGGEIFSMETAVCLP